MAGNLQGGRGIASLGKRFVNQIGSSLSPSLVVSRRAVHISVYDKNLEENVELVQPATVPDHVIQPESENYWTPHPQTGVFGPPGEPAAGGERIFHTLAESASEGSVLTQTTFFRPLEDLEKPPAEP